MKRSLLGLSVLVLTASTAMAQQRPAEPMSQPTTMPSSTSTMSTRSDMPPYTPDPGPRKGDWELFLGGTGGSNGEFNDNALGVNGEVGYYVLQWLPVSLRQSYVTRFGGKVNDRHDFATTLGADFQAPLGRFQPYAGGFVGYSYGDQSSGLAGPEAGIKYYVNESTFLKGQMQYGWLFDKTLDWDNGRALYTIGFGYNF
jgi:hypothetical protein